VIATDNLQRVLHLPTGQPADAIRLTSDLEEAAKLYHSKGYMMARITPKPLLDDEHSTVRYELSVQEGDQFKMGEFEVNRARFAGQGSSSGRVEAARGRPL